MTLGIADILFMVHTATSWIGLFYTANFYYLLYRALTKKSRPPRAQLRDPPCVTIQLPIYNERYVARRLLEAVGSLNYPRGKLQIQVLDDSTDDTLEICKSLVSDLQSKGFWVEHITRPERVGYKAGALSYGLSFAKGQFIAIFDADFIPEPDFLVKALPYFSSKEVGIVQARWAHLNQGYSMLTKAQGLSLDLHFFIEQRARSYCELFMNFNGTAGIIRRECIEDAGGWEFTLTEDLDLSYRAQLKGWKAIYLDGVQAPAELPVQINAVKRQQFRWAKGAAQCARKLLKRVILARLPLSTKVQAFLQLTRHVVYPMLVLDLLILPFLMRFGFNLSQLTALISGMIIPQVSYLFALRTVYKNGWLRKVPDLLFMGIFYSGLCVVNSKAFMEGLLSLRGKFDRTPKFGIISNRDTWRDKRYVLPFSLEAIWEFLLGVYGILTVLVALISRNFLLLPNLIMQVTGLLYISLLTFMHSWGIRQAL